MYTILCSHGLDPMSCVLYPVAYIISCPIECFKLSFPLQLSKSHKSDPILYPESCSISLFPSSTIPKGSSSSGCKLFWEASSFARQLEPGWLPVLHLLLSKISCTCFQTWRPSAPVCDSLQRSLPQFPLCICLSGLSLRHAWFWSPDSQRWDWSGLGHRNIFQHQLTWWGKP